MPDKPIVIDPHKAERLAKSVSDIATKADGILKTTKQLADRVQTNPTPEKLQEVIDALPLIMSEARQVLDLNLSLSQTIESVQKDLSNLRLSNNRRAQVGFSLVIGVTTIATTALGRYVPNSAMWVAMGIFAGATAMMGWWFVQRRQISQMADAVDIAQLHFLKFSATVQEIYALFEQLLKFATDKRSAS